MKRTLAILMALLLCAALLPMGALAAASKTVYISSTGTGSLNLRGGPGKDYSPVGFVYHGDKVTPGKKSGEWTRVTVNDTGDVGWIKTKYIDGTTKALGSGTWKVTASSAVKLRSGPGTGYGTRGTAQPGDRVKVLNTEDDWIRVTVQGSGLTGWMKASAIGKASGGSGSGGTQPSAPTAQKVRTVTSETLNVRSGPGSGYGLVGKLNYGTALRVLGTSGSWLRVIAYDGASGWVFANYTEPGALATVSAGKLNVRSGPGSGSAKVGALLAGDTCTVSSITGDWAKISGDLLDGYVFLRYLVF